MTLTLALANSASNCTVHFTVQLTNSVLLLLLLSSDTTTNPVEAGDLKFPIPGQYTGSSSSSRGELSYLAPLGSENISAPYFKQ